MHNCFRNGVKFGLLQLFVGVVAIFLFLGLSLYENRQQNPERILERVQKEILSIELNSSDLLNRMSATVTQGNLQPGWKGSAKSSIPHSGGYTLMICKGDSVVFWSDNTVPIPEKYFLHFEGSSSVDYFKNGWYFISGKKTNGYTFWTFFLLRHEYAFQNDFLKNGFNPIFNIPDWIGIGQDKTRFPVYSNDGRYLFSLLYGLDQIENPSWSILLLLLVLIGMTGILLFIYKLCGNWIWFVRHKRAYVMFCAGTFVIIRLIQCYFQFPAKIYGTPLFGPELHSSSVILPSLGDFVINGFVLLLMAYVYYRQWPASARKQHQSALLRSGRIFLASLVLAGWLVLAAFLLKALVTNSSFPLDFRNISDFTAASIWGVVVVCCILLAVLFFFLRTLENLAKRKFSNPTILLLLFLICLFSTAVLNNANTLKEKEKRKILAIKLAGRRNPLTEILYEKLERKILSDTSIVVSIKNDTLPAYLSRGYFSDYWNKFNTLVTVCSNRKTLKVQPQGYEVNCRDYFSNTITTVGEATQNPDLYFLDYGFGNENYLAAIPVNYSTADGPMTIYLEFNAKSSYRDLGYPELLMDTKHAELPNIQQYSYGLYRDGTLVHAVGKFAYRMVMNLPVDTNRQGVFFEGDGMDHYGYSIDKKNMLLVSRSLPGILDNITPFSYLFILTCFLLVIFYVVINIPEFPSILPITLKNRLQILMVGVLLVSFLIVGLISGINIIGLNAVKNEVSLRERSVSVLVEMQHKYGHRTSLTEAGSEELDNLLIKFSNVFFTDINIYNPQGKIIGSSRQQIFDEGLVSDRMNSEAFYQLAKERQSSIIQEEFIGKLQYSSAYLPFYNDQGTLLGYLNLPYFSRQDELKKEVSSFLVTVVNIYVLLVIAGIMIIFFIARYITSPLAVLAGKLAQLQLGRNNEKISWKREDEIGKLVEEYNRMIDELGRSAELLARSEREGAWREMARQVAHEIKNPLTPMKLSIQYLQKMWTEEAPDRELRLERLTGTLMEQIDTLAAIANEFSDFSNMSEPVLQNIDLNEIIGSATSLYMELDNIRFKYESVVRNAIILGDRKQFLRAFTNLFNNSIQAIGERNEGCVSILLTKEESHYTVTITDNGDGIPSELAGRIFQPNFTTKSGGMGLGLAIVKGIIQGSGGEINYVQPKVGGTTFIIRVPAVI